MSYLRYLCLFAYSGVQHIFCCVFACFFFVLLTVFLDCPFLIGPSIFPGNLEVKPSVLLNSIQLLHGYLS